MMTRLAVISASLRTGTVVPETAAARGAVNAESAGTNSKKPNAATALNQKCSSVIRSLKDRENTAGNQ